MLVKIVIKSLRQHALSTVVTALAIALAAGLVMSIFAIQRQTYAAFTGGDAGFDAVLGARGSQLQLVLNTVFHLETSPGNIPFALYGLAIATEQNHTIFLEKPLKRSKYSSNLDIFKVVYQKI